MYFDNPIYIAGLGSYLPTGRALPQEALAAGMVTERDLAETDYASIAVEERLYPPAMASHAARQAVQRARIAPRDIELVVYAANHRHGHRLFWSPASFLQRELGVPNAFAVNVYAGCTAQMSMSDLAISYLQADPKRRAAIVIAADRYAASPGNRWTGDYGIFMGDGAAAVVYSKTPGIARVLSINTRTLPEFEEVHRMDAEEEQNDATWRAEYDIRETKRRFVSLHGGQRLAEATRGVTEELYARSLAEAGISSRDVVKLLLPNLGRKHMEATYFRLCEGDLERCTWHDFGRTIGHIGPPDQILGLDHLLQSGALRPFDRVALLGAGAGFSWSCMIIEILPQE